MNLALFSILFTFGFLTGRFFGFTLWMAIALLSISAFVGLNPQQPVPSQTIIDTFLGVIIGVGIGAIVARLLWPVLPQRVLRDDLLALIARCRALVRGEPAGEALEMELALFSVEATQAARQIRMPKCPAAEKARLFAYVQLLMKLVTQIKALASRRAGLPEAALAILRPSFERLEGGFTRTLDAFAGCFRNGDPRGDFPSFRGDLSAMMQAVEQIRASGMLAASKLEIPLQMLDLANRYRAISETLEECGRIIQSLELELYWGDYAL